MKLTKNLVTLVLLSTSTVFSYASHSCAGTVGYLGIGTAGELITALNGRPIHKICSVGDQGAFAMNVAACKVAYSILLAAKISGKSVALYYFDDSKTCEALPSWGVVNDFYFIEGPN